MGHYWDLGLIAASGALLIVWLLGRLRADLSGQIRTVNGIRTFIALLPLSLYAVVFFMYHLSHLLGKPLWAIAGILTITISILGLLLLFLICALFLGLMLLHVLRARIEPALRSRQIRAGTQALLRLQISIGECKAGLLANLILLMMMPVPLFLLRFRRQLFDYFPTQVGWQSGAPFYILAGLMLATALYGLRRHYYLWLREMELYRKLT